MLSNQLINIILQATIKCLYFPKYLHSVFSDLRCFIVFLCLWCLTPRHLGESKFSQDLNIPFFCSSQPQIQTMLPLWAELRVRLIGAIPLGNAQTGQNIVNKCHSFPEGWNWQNSVFPLDLTSCAMDRVGQKLPNTPQNFLLFCVKCFLNWTLAWLLQISELLTGFQSSHIAIFVSLQLFT